VDGKPCGENNSSTNILDIYTKRTEKDGTELIDPKSTWRKRAAIAYPLAKELPCEWQGKANVGGGKYPIVGCKSNNQLDIHHGPVKIEIGIKFDFNQKGNVHRICRVCHHLWHHWNDEPYKAEEWMLLPHSPVDATLEQLELWSNSKTRPKAPEPRTKPINVGVD
jgi:hypothetical protein